MESTTTGVAIRKHLIEEEFAREYVALLESKHAIAQPNNREKRTSMIIVMNNKKSALNSEETIKFSKMLTSCHIQCIGG